MIQIEFVHGEPGEIVKNDPPCLHVPDGIRTIEQHDAFVDLLEAGSRVFRTNSVRRW